MTPTHRSYDMTDTNPLREAAEYILDGMGIDGPDYTVDPDDDFLEAANSQWVKETLTRLAAALAAAPQPAVADREALVDADSLSRHIGELGNQIHNLVCKYQNDEKLSERLGELRATAWDLERRAHALLARGLRLTDAPETLAWAVVREDGAVLANTVRWGRDDVDAKFGDLGPSVRVAIRVVEGGDDAA